MNNNNLTPLELAVKKELMRQKGLNFENNAREGTLTRTCSFNNWTGAGSIIDKSLKNALALYDQGPNSSKGPSSSPSILAIQSSAYNNGAAPSKVPPMFAISSKNSLQNRVKTEHGFLMRGNNNIPPKTWKNLNNAPPKMPPGGLKRKATGNELQFLPYQKSSGPPCNNSKNHAIEKSMEGLFCDLCEVIFSGPLVMQQHLKGRPHKAKLEYAQMKRSCAASPGNNSKPRCELCQIWCTNRNALEMHFKGRKHKDKVQELECCKKNNGASALKRPIMCELCLVNCMNEEGLAMHKKGKPHAAKLELNRRGLMQ